MIASFESLIAPPNHDVCVVGSGPIGLALALACAKRGLRVLLLESGKEVPSEFYTGLGRGIIHKSAAHTSLEEANCRALGGTSHWWGGRCVPFDPIDFVARPWVEHSGWPIAYEEMARWHEAAAAFLCCGSAEFSIKNPWKSTETLRFDTLERWTVTPNIAAAHHAELASLPNLHIVLGATVTDLHFTEDLTSVTSLTVADASRKLAIQSPCCVLACGGVQTPRLLLAVQRTRSSLFGGADGPLGRFYMGHIFGKIADLILKDPGQAGQLDFFIDSGVYVRRRLTLADEVQKQRCLPQISFTAGNAKISNPVHRSGPLSVIWLMLASPLGKRLLPEALRKMYVGEKKDVYKAHLANVLRSIIPTTAQAFRIFWERYVKKPGKPSVFIKNAGGRYALHYHGEQSPSADNRLTLSGEADALGMPRVAIDFTYSRADALAVVRNHQVLDKALRESAMGHLEYQDEADAANADNVIRQARDGMHQIGAARMSRLPADGVVDENCKVHGVDNLFIASTCVFPTSGQANPTFLGVALALRLAEHIAALGK